MPNLLLIAVFLPLVGAVLLGAAGRLGHTVVRSIALATTLLTLAAAGTVVFGDPRAYEIDLPWLGAQYAVDIRFSMGLDGLSLWMFGLSALLTLTAVLVSWEAITDRAASFYALLLLLESGMLGVFAARDIILFYVFFEFTLIPLFFLIGIWGSEERRYAAVKFFLFTLAGSVLTFLGLLAIVVWDYYYSGVGLLTFQIPALTANLALRPIDPAVQVAIFLALFAGFAIKVPLFPFHTWLPLAHVQAPTAGSVLLAGVLLKIGSYGFVRFCLPMLPEATVFCMPWVLWLSLAGILYGAFVALAQTDIKRLIAYSSVSHMGFCMLGLFALNRLGLQGGVMQMISHGLSTGALFAIVGMIYERYHTRQIADLGGLAKRTPRLAAAMVLFTLSSIGLPGLNGFVGEFMLLVGMFQRAWAGPELGPTLQWRVISVAAVLGVVLGAWYMLSLVERVFFGPLREPAGHGAGTAPVRDLSWREAGALAPIAVFVFWIGIGPKFFLDRMQADLDPIADCVAQAVEEPYAWSIAARVGPENAESGGELTRVP